jgi:hypothetical protein
VDGRSAATSSSIPTQPRRDAATDETVSPTASRAALEDTARRIQRRLAESPDLRSLGKRSDQVTRTAHRAGRRRAPGLLRQRQRGRGTEGAELIARSSAA